MHYCRFSDFPENVQPAHYFTVLHDKSIFQHDKFQPHYCCNEVDSSVSVGSSTTIPDRRYPPPPLIEMSGCVRDARI
jgi:hypothetical protein